MLTGFIEKVPFAHREGVGRILRQLIDGNPAKYPQVDTMCFDRHDVLTLG